MLVLGVGLGLGLVFSVHLGLGVRGGVRIRLGLGPGTRLDPYFLGIQFCSHLPHCTMK